MLDARRVITTLHRAAELFRSTPGRTGRVLMLANVEDVLVVGDLHGNLGHFQSAIQRADLPRHPRRHLVLQEVIHGSQRYADGGDKSHQLLDLVAALKCQFPERVHFLPGNHEVAQVAGRAVIKDDVDFNALFVAGVDTAYGERADEVYAAYGELIAAAPLVVRTPNRIFISHSLPSRVKLPRFRYDDLLRETTPDDLAPTGSVYALSWGRDVEAEHVGAFLRLVDADWLITGHIPCEAGVWAPNDRQIVLDAMRSPGGYCLTPADRPITHAELLACTGTW